MQSQSEYIQQLPPATHQHVIAHRALLVNMLSDAAVLPKKNTVNSAGYDLSSAVDAVVQENDKAIVPAEISGMIVDGTFDRIAPRSGPAA